MVSYHQLALCALHLLTNRHVQADPLAIGGSKWLSSSSLTKMITFWYDTRASQCWRMAEEGSKVD
jgi:hypothetical protein